MTDTNHPPGFFPEGHDAALEAVHELRRRHVPGGSVVAIFLDIDGNMTLEASLEDVGHALAAYLALQKAAESFPEIMLTAIAKALKESP